MSRCSPTDSIPTLTRLPDEVQIQILSFLRAFDLSPVQQTCKFYKDPGRIHEVVTYFVDHVYGPDLTKGIEIIPVEDDSNDDKNAGNRQQHGKFKKASSPSSKATKNSSPTSVPATQPRYTLEHLRYIELTVVARVLSLPEPKTGFYVSKSWIKKALLWLEKVNEPQQSNNNSSNKKLSKKQQRQRHRRLSDVSPPWPNANSDILCEHHNLQRCSAKAARSRRKLMDKQAWKVLRKLYPDSTQLESVAGECLTCLMENETARKNEQDRLEHEKLERKKPLANPTVRQFYTRTKGVPTQCLVDNPANGSGGGGVAAAAAAASDNNRRASSCPLVEGTYFVIPRAWCHQWRRYMKTGEGSMPRPPESSALLCDAHKLALLPPHLEAFLSGETPQLLASVKQDIASIAAAASSIATASPVGVHPTLDLAMVNALMAAGISQAEFASQRMAMLHIQAEQQQQRLEPAWAPPTPRRDSFCNNELLDRENHVVVELVTREEWMALQETGCWPKQFSHYSVEVNVDKNGSFGFSTLPCRDCDPTGLRFTSCASIKNKFRSKRWEPKSVEQKRVPNMEY